VVSGNFPSATARFALRALGARDDTAPFQRWARDARIMGPLNLPARHLTHEQIAQYWAGFDNQTRFFIGIFDAADKPVGFWEVECDAVHAKATISLGIDPDYRGVAVVQETAIALFDGLFARGIEKIVALTLPANRPVLAIMRQGGFRDEGVLRQEVRALAGTSGKQNARLDQIRLGLLPEDWKTGRENFRAFVARKTAKRAGRAQSSESKTESRHVQASSSR
jgi:RimJ/RimL family protein N-acetyltransferase